jgi:hypothetical protein
MAESQTATKEKALTGNRVYLYQPSGVEDRSVGIRVFMYKNPDDKIKKVNVQRGVWVVTAEQWNGIEKSVYGQELIETRQLVLIANSNNIFEDFVKPNGVNGSIRIEDIIDKTFDKTDTGLLRLWASWLKSQDMTKQAIYSSYLERINKRLESPSSPFDLPSYSNAPLDPSFNNYSQGLGQI